MGDERPLHVRRSLPLSSNTAADDKGGAVRRKGGDHERVPQRLLSAGRRVGARRGAGRGEGPDISAMYVALRLSACTGAISRLNLTRLEAGSCGAASQVGLPEDEGGTGGGSGSDGGGGDGGGRQPSTRVELHLVLPSTGP